MTPYQCTVRASTIHGSSERPLDKNKLLTGRYIDVREKPDRTKNKLFSVRLQGRKWQNCRDNKCFHQEAYERDTERVIVAITSLNVSTYLGDLQLGSTAATHSYVNPCISQPAPLIQRFKHMPATEMPSAPGKYEQPESNLTPFSVVISHLLDTKKESTYTCLARIMDIDCGHGKRWCYMSCFKCANKVFECGHLFKCLSNGDLDEHSHRFEYTANVSDGTCTAKVFFDNIATSLVGSTCYDLRISQQNDPMILLPEIVQQNIVTLPVQIYESCLECANKVYECGHLFKCCVNGDLDEHSHRFHLQHHLGTPRLLDSFLSHQPISVSLRPEPFLLTACQAALFTVGQLDARS